jgi:hypothetical protein
MFGTKSKEGMALETPVDPGFPMSLGEGNLKVASCSLICDLGYLCSTMSTVQLVAAVYGL